MIFMTGSIDDRLDPEFIRIIAGTMEIDPKLITPEKDLRKDLGADSIDLPRIAVNLEDHYGRELSDDVLNNQIFTVRELYDYFHIS